MSRRKNSATRMVIPAEAICPDLTEAPLALRLDDGRRVKAQETVVVATGARYRRLNIPNLTDFGGARYLQLPGFADRGALCAGTKRSFWSVAATRPARPRSSCATSPKNLDAGCVGQASQRACRNILIDRICAIDNIEVLTQTEIIALYGSREKAAGARALAQQS